MKRRFYLQRANYKHHNELAQKIVASYSRSVDHYSDEEHNKFDLNISMNTLQNSLNRPSNFIIIQGDQGLRDTNNISPCTSQRHIEEDKLTSTYITMSESMGNVPLCTRPSQNLLKLSEFVELDEPIILV